MKFEFREYKLYLYWANNFKFKHFLHKNYLTYCIYSNLYN